MCVDVKYLVLNRDDRPRYTTKTICIKCGIILFTNCLRWMSLLENLTSINPCHLALMLYKVWECFHLHPSRCSFACAGTSLVTNSAPKIDFYHPILPSRGELYYLYRDCCWLGERAFNVAITSLGDNLCVSLWTPPARDIKVQSLRCNANFNIKIVCLGKGSYALLLFIYQQKSD